MWEEEAGALITNVQACVLLPGSAQSCTDTAAGSQQASSDLAFREGRRKGELAFTCLFCLISKIDTARAMHC